MSLGNLSIKVSADVGAYTYNMDGVAITAKERMGQSAAAVEGFRASVLKTSQDLEKAAAAMGSNMQAANDEIMAGAKEASAAVAGITESAAKVDMTTWSEKIASAFGNGIGAGIVAAQTGLNAFIAWTKTKAIVVGAVITAAFAAVGLGAAYTAYKVVSATIDTIKGLMNGDFYKSENIDSLIKSNNELKDLQKNLHVSSIEAGALNETFKRLGVTQSDYQAVYDGIASSTRTNGEELDRLGVRYKDANGKILENKQVMENAKTVLDSYTEGWDRNQAAAAIGVGTYAQITDALKITDEQVAISKARMDEYQLGISAGAQVMITEYEQAMREFGRETDLMSQGFKRVIADAVMPAFTDLANWFKDGWPSIVQAFRVGVSTIVGLFYALKNGVYIVTESILATVEALASAVGGVGRAAAKLAQGDLTGASEAIAKGWEGAKDRIKLAGANIVTQVMENDKKIRLATAADGRDASIASAKNPKTGKAWVAKPKEEKAQAAAAVRADPFDGAMNNLGSQVAGIDFVIANFDKFEGKVKESKSAMAEFDVTMGKFSDKQRISEKFEPLTAAQKAAYISTSKYLQDQVETERQLQALRKLDKSVEQFQFQEQQQLDFRKQDIEWMGKSQQELAKLTEVRRIDGQIAAMIHQTEQELGKNGLKITQDQIDAINAKGDAIKNASKALVDQAYDKARDPYFNLTESVRQYGEAAQNVGQQVGQAMQNAFKGAEDALVTFAMTGKLSFGDLAKSILSDLARIQAKNLIASLTGSGKGDSGLIGAAGSALGKLLGFADGGDPPLNTPSVVGENGPELFVPKGSGTIIPNHALQGGAGGGNVTVQNTYHIDSRTDQSTIAQMLERNKAATKADIQNMMNRSRNAFARH
jgi:lambda family phage tail tape measure protein